MEEENKDIVADIANDLAKTESDKAPEETVVQAEESKPFDLNNLTPTQLLQLKQMLHATPDRVVGKKPNPRVMMREIDGKIVVAFKPAYRGIAFDTVTQKEHEALYIPVLFAGEKEYKNIKYKEEFMSADRISCEVVSQREQKERIGLGTEVVQKETGRLVELEYSVLHQWFTIKLPNGDTVEVEGEFVNA